jgi:hypothetical protein
MEEVLLFNTGYTSYSFSWPVQIHRPSSEIHVEPRAKLRSNQKEHFPRGVAHKTVRVKRGSDRVLLNHGNLGGRLSHPPIPLKASKASESSEARRPSTWHEGIVSHTYPTLSEYVFVAAMSPRIGKCVSNG